MELLWTALVGFVVGLIARAVLPGTQAMGIILTTLLGIAGSFIAGFVGQSLGWYQMGQGAGFIGSLVGAIVLLFIVGKLKGPGASGG
ncbi:GlsB/YeaQ/YmgE family stress response membrane protein [Piscinibacter sp.]|uniref:GlsB/YeaQ/YmgE family stress response membrane protein n=1 Tax=Piscinibacter sp. TaxID=1903157 RepID=UPI0039E7294D